MNDGLIAVVVALGGAAAQVLNVWLNLRLRAALLEAEQRILERVDEIYVRKDVCAERHGERPPRLRARFIEESPF